MISATIKLSVTGNNYDELLQKSKIALSEFFDIQISEVESKINFELIITDNIDTLDFQEEDYVAEIIAKVKNV